MEKKLASTARLSVSVVLYHSPVELLLSTIGSLYKASLIALNEGQLSSVSVQLIDNSQSRTYATHVAKALQGEEYDDFFLLHYIEAEGNNGFGAGHNRVLPKLTSDYHLVLNPDVELAGTALSRGLSVLHGDTALALVSPRVFGRTGEQEFLCKSYPSVWVLLLRAFTPAFFRRYFKAQLHRYEMRELCEGNKAGDILLASGCFMLMRSEAFIEAGGFNEDYFLYFEDFDLSLRLGERGRLQFYPAMEITHHGGYAASKGFGHIWLFIKSGARFFGDHGWKWI